MSQWLPSNWAIDVDVDCVAKQRFVFVGRAREQIPGVVGRNWIAPIKPPKVQETGIIRSLFEYRTIGYHVSYSFFSTLPSLKIIDA
jgi:hypothetical protein